MEFLSTFFYEAMIRISRTFLFDATGCCLTRGFLSFLGNPFFQVIFCHGRLILYNILERLF